CFSLVVNGQTGHSFDHFCGSHQGRSVWLKKYQATPQAYAKGGDTTVYIPMTIHILGTDSGSGYYSVRSLLDAMCTLNTTFEQTGLQFYIAGEILYHNNTAYYVHSTVLEGAEMMFEYNVPNTLNTYFVSDPAGNCGYNLPYAGIANAKSCSGPDDITWSHEVGHALSLPHPFLGWEGGVSYDGSVDHNFNNPAPDFVTYDYTFFQDTLILDTLIIDTAFVELVDRSNCDVAADGFCDTDSDYLAQRWSCNSDDVSPITQRDPDGVSFRSDGSLVMNYANDACQDRFSLEQTGAMRAFLYDERTSWVSTATPLAPILSEVTVIAPVEGVTVGGQTATLTWEAVANATQYLVQISRLSSFSSAVTETYVTASTSFETEELLDDRTYYWRVRPFNAYSTCQDFSERESFVIDHDLVNLANSIHTLASWTIRPQPVSSGQLLELVWQLTDRWQGELQIINSLGQVIDQQTVYLQAGRNTKTIATHQLAAGLYFLRLSNGSTQAVRKIVVE
ncbi:MAG: T9SS type A sorting domain-containing protein, partial [Bacteroidota bacterium]